MIDQRQRTTLVRAINRMVRAERWLASEVAESELRGQTQFLNHATREHESARAALTKALDRITAAGAQP